MNGHAYDPIQVQQLPQVNPSNNDPSIDIAHLLNAEIPKCQETLLSSHQNLDVLATYCDEKYQELPNKGQVLEQTREYCTQSLASVAYQINNLAGNFIAVLDLQSAHLESLESSLKNINCAVDIHREKVARREIGNITSNKSVVNTQGAKIRKPATELSPLKYSRKRVDLSELDNIGHGISLKHDEQPLVQRKSSIMNQSLIQDQNSMGGGSTLSRSSINTTHTTISSSSGFGTMSGTGTLRGKPVSVPAAPTAPESYQPGSLAMKSLQKKSDINAPNIESLGLPISYEERNAYDMQRMNRSETQQSDTSSVASGGTGSDYKFAAEAFGYGGGGHSGSNRLGSVGSSGTGDYRLRGDAFRYTSENPAVMQQKLGRKPSQTSQAVTPNIPEDMEYVGGEFRPVIKEDPNPQDFSPYSYSQQRPNIMRPQMQLPPHLAGNNPQFQQQNPQQQQNQMQNVNSGRINQQFQQQQQQQPQTQYNMGQGQNMTSQGHRASVNSSHAASSPMSPPIMQQMHQQQQMMQQQPQKQVKIMQQPQVTNLADISANLNQKQHNMPQHQNQQHHQAQQQHLSQQHGSNIMDPQVANTRYNAPQAPPNLDKCEKVVALYDYTAEQSDELTFVEGQIIFVMKKNDDGWYEGLMPPHYHRGLFPGNYVETVPSR